MLRIFRKCRKINRLAYFLTFIFLFAGCDPFSDRKIPKDISGTWSGSIVEGTRYSNITLKLSHSGTLVTGSWTTAIHGSGESGGISGSYYNGKAYLTLSLESNVIGSMLLRFDDNVASGTGTERNNDFEIRIKKI